MRLGIALALKGSLALPLRLLLTLCDITLHLTRMGCRVGAVCRRAGGRGRGRSRRGRGGKWRGLKQLALALTHLIGRRRDILLLCAPALRLGPLHPVPRVESLLPGRQRRQGVAAITPCGLLTGGDRES